EHVVVQSRLYLPIDLHDSNMRSYPVKRSPPTMIKQQQTLRRAREAGRSKIGPVKFSDRRSSHSHAVGIEQRARRPCLRDGRDVRLVSIFTPRAADSVQTPRR